MWTERGRGPRLLVTDCWLANAGDAAIAEVTDTIVRRVFPTAEVKHAAYQWQELGDTVPGLDLVPPLEALLAEETGSRYPCVVDGEALVDGADLVISQGGGFLSEHYEPWTRTRALAAAKARGKGVMVLGQTISRFDDAATRRHLRAALTGGVFGVVRDPTSARWLCELGVLGLSVHVGSDLTVLSERPTAPDRGATVLVVTATAPTAALDTAVQWDLAHTLASEVADLADGPVVLASSVMPSGPTGYRGEDDGPLMAAAATTMRGRGAEVEVLGGLGLPALLSVLGSARRVVSMRLHPVLLALGAGVPSMLFMDAPKADCLDGVSGVRCADPGDPTGRSAALRDLWTRHERGRIVAERLGPARDRLRGLEGALTAAVARLVPGPSAGP